MLYSQLALNMKLSAIYYLCFRFLSAGQIYYFYGTPLVLWSIVLTKKRLRTRPFDWFCVSGVNLNRLFAFFVALRQSQSPKRRVHKEYHILLTQCVKYNWSTRIVLSVVAVIVVVLEVVVIVVIHFCR
jgi:hypothetical protein